MQKQSSNSVKIKYPPSVELLSKILYKFISGTRDPNISKIIIIGSYARKTPRYRSDVDLVIITKNENTNLFDRLYTELIDISTDFEWAPMIISSKNLQKRSQKWLKMLETEGVELYPRFNYRIANK